MFRRLDQKEIEIFTIKYLPMWNGEIYDVSLIEYNHIKEYMVNGHYLVLDYGNKITHKDLQF